MKRKIAEKIQKIMIGIAVKSVGKSFPVGMFEKRIPEEVYRKAKL